MTSELGSFYWGGCSPSVAVIHVISSSVPAETPGGTDALELIAHCGDHVFSYGVGGGTLPEFGEFCEAVRSGLEFCTGCIAAIKK